MDKIDRLVTEQWFSKVGNSQFDKAHFLHGQLLITDKARLTKQMEHRSVIKKIKHIRKSFFDLAWTRQKIASDQKKTWDRMVDK